MKRQRGPYINPPATPDEELTAGARFGFAARVTRGDVHAAAVAHKTGARGLAAEIGVSARTVFRWIHGGSAKRNHSEAETKLERYFARIRG